MLVIVVGAGQVGRYVAGSLEDKHDVVVIDIDPNRVEKARQELDVLTIHGDGNDLDTLKEANVADSDMIVASTTDDKTNIVTCGMAKILSDASTIARVNGTQFYQSWRQGKRALGVDFMIGSNFLTARTICQVVGLPSAHDIDSFAEGAVYMVEFEATKESPILGRKIRDLMKIEDFSYVNFMAIFREDEEGFIYPRGDTTFQPGDRILTTGDMPALHHFSNFIDPSNDEPSQKEVVIFGGGEVGQQTAEILEKGPHDIRLIEADEQRAQFLAENLPDTLVLNQDAENPDFLLHEHVDEADVVIGALGEDEKNLLVSLLSKQLGAKRSISVVEHAHYIDLFEQVGVDVAINPRRLTAEEISAFTRRDEAENIAILESEHVEVLELKVSRDSMLAGQTIEDLVKNLPQELVFGAIVREGELILPRGEVRIKSTDHVVILADADQLQEIEELIA